jgi:hypothetical protein
MRERKAGVAIVGSHVNHLGAKRKRAARSGNLADHLVSEAIPEIAPPARKLLR